MLGCGFWGQLLVLRGRGVKWRCWEHPSPGDPATDVSFSSSSSSSSSCPAPRGRISRTQVSDAGLYTCVVSSQAGVADRSFVLQILGMEELGI